VQAAQVGPQLGIGRGLQPPAAPVRAIASIPSGAARVSETARISSRCPSTGTAISLTVTPNGPADVSPRETVVSFLVPVQQFDATSCSASTCS
jgi:hypothetical protein